MHTSTRRLVLCAAIAFAIVVAVVDRLPTWKKLQVPAEVVRGGATYKSTNIEEKWTAKGPRYGKLCKTSEKQYERAQKWTEYSESIFDARKKPYPEPSPEVKAMLPSFRTGDSDVSYIEPLTGVARHPLWSACKHNQDIGFNSRDLFDIRYLILENRCGSSKPKPGRVLYFDMGCTVYAAGPDESGKFDPEWGTTQMKNLMGSGAGPSIPLFYNLYRDRCLEFDEIFAWEGLKQDQEKWWGPVPEFLKPKINFYNFFIEENSLKESIKGEKEPPKASVLRKILETATEDDFVILKVDIDGGSELEVVEAIANRPELSRLVDEIFFEYHFDYDGVFFGWGKDVILKNKNVDDAIGLLHRLRAAGVRSHFWI